MLASRPVTLLVAGAVGAAFVVGLLVEGVGGALVLLGVTAVLAGLTVAAWHHVPERARPLRLAVLALVAVITAVKLVRALD
jgi:hypothetical protein